MDAVIPLEQEDPCLAEHIRQIANREHGTVRGFDASWHTRRYRLHDGQVVEHRSRTPGRNDACPCGSGLKFKKCCLPLM